MLTAFLTVFLGTLLHLDRYAVAHTMVHRPIFVGAALGWVGGFALEGALVGLVLEFVALFQPPTGSDLPQDETAMTVTTISATIAFGQDPVHWLPLMAALSLPVAASARQLERMCRLINADIQRRVERSGLRLEKNLGRAPWLAIAARFSLTLGFLFTTTFIVWMIASIIDWAGVAGFFIEWAQQLLLLIPVVGVGYELFRPGALRRARWVASGVVTSVLIWGIA